ncbi:MAG: 50S ribosomal protein L31e [Euryarchaeota archaeon]|nr:50S ribosomal protein L31e [Euryarchaeota archaeon]
MESGEERIYTIPLRKAKRASRKKRSAKAVKVLKDFLRRHTKTENIQLDAALNEKVWERGIEKPPAKLRIRVKKEGDTATAYLTE